MLYLNKLLPIFVLPLGWVVLLLAIAIWRRKRWPLFAALVVLYLSSMPAVGNIASRTCSAARAFGSCARSISES